MKLSVVTPLYCSAPYIDELYRRSVAAIAATGVSAHEFIFVNDRSPDDSLAVAKRIAEQDANVIVVDLARNFGQHKAIMTGFAYATGDYIFVMDSDLEEEPEWIGLFFREMSAKGCDVVYGVSSVKKGSFFYTLARRFFYRTLNFLSAVRFPEDVCIARLMTRRYLNALLQFKEREVWLAGILHMTGFMQLPVKVIKRQSSRTTYTMAGLARMFINGVTAFSTRPLAMIAIAGILLSLLAFTYTAWIVIQKIVYGIAVEGWASVMAAILLIGGITLFFNGVMAIYIAKIYLEVKQRPSTIVRELYHSRPIPWRSN
jgi:putative glycosyltransferase